MEKSQLNHVGFIVDGNRRWAKENNLPSSEGHKKGLEKIEKVIEAVAKEKIPFASFYIFSTENWSRKPNEISFLMNLIKTKIESLMELAKKNDLKCVFLSADNGKLEKEIEKRIKEVELKTEKCKSGTIGFCLNYGGKQEIADAAYKISKENGEFTADNIEKHLYHPEIPACDIIVRTSGEKRLSGFMLWRSAYSERPKLKQKTSNRY